MDVVNYYSNDILYEPEKQILAIIQDELDGSRVLDIGKETSTGNAVVCACEPVLECEIRYEVEHDGGLGEYTLVRLSDPQSG